jgi:hypothetical protein
MADDEPTCGKGIAAHAVISHKLGALIDGIADNFEQHLPALDGNDAATRGERAAYASLLVKHREIATLLRAVGDEMASCQGLAMPAHDMAVLQAEPAAKAFEHYIVTLRATVAALQAVLAEDQQLA